MNSPITTFLLAGRRGPHYAARLFRDGRPGLACLCMTLHDLAALQRLAGDALGRGVLITLEGDDQELARALGEQLCIGVAPIALVAAQTGLSLPRATADAESIAALAAPGALVALDEAALGTLEAALAGALLRLRGWRLRPPGEPAPLLVQASVENLEVPWHDRADYILTVDQPWPPALEEFRELFAGARHGADVQLDFQDEKEHILIRPLA